jgi:hypothetical protein
MAFGRFVADAEDEAFFRQDPKLAASLYAGELERLGFTASEAWAMADRATEEALTDPALDQAYAEYQQQQELEAYDAQVAQLVVENPDVDPQLFHGFAAASEGDLDHALELYRDHAAKMDKDSFDRLGLTHEQIIQLQAENRAAEGLPLVGYMNHDLGAPTSGARSSGARDTAQQQDLDYAIERATANAVAKARAGRR